MAKTGHEVFSEAKWIWMPGERQPINRHICFRKTFAWEGLSGGQATLHLSADTKYRLWINGTELGEGPIRSTASHWFYDSYNIGHLLQTGTNVIAVKVWHYGHSNYQYVEHEAGLIAELELTDETGRQTWVSTDESWLYKPHAGYDVHVVKRNVNIGWMEIYDAAVQADDWVLPDFDDQQWMQSHRIAAYADASWGQLHPRGIEPFSSHVLHPAQMIELNEIQPLRKVLSINMRDNFFADARDANAKIFSGFLASKLIVTKTTAGRLTFAHSRWNGVQGRFKIGATWHEHNEALHLPPGQYLFLMEICGVHNDLFTHMELDFDQDLQFAHPFMDGAEAAFITIGPVESISSFADGYQPVYGGVEKETGLNLLHPLLVAVGKCETPGELAQYRDESKDVAPHHVMVDKMIYSLMMRKQTLHQYAVTGQLERLLHDHALPTVLPEPKRGGDIEFIVDFGKIYVGAVSFEVDAPEGTVIDFYGFEHRLNGANAYTSGCNNSFRYICREGRQTFKSGTRMGFRYLMAAVRGASNPVRFYQVALHQSSYPASNKALFRCSDPLLNDIWEISRHTSQMCMEDTFVDCPTFEQVFWVGDCRVSALVNYHLFGSYELVRHCLEMVPRSREQSPLLLALLPTDWQAAIPMWTFSWVIACEEYVAYSGDKSFESVIYPEIRATLDAYRGFLNEQGLFDTSSWNLLDWAPIDIPYVGVVTAQQALLARCHQIAAAMAERLGLSEEAAGLHTHASQMKDAIRDHLWDEERHVYLDGIHRSGERSTTTSLQTHILLYLTDCMEPEQAAIITPQLLDPPDDWIAIGSPFFAFYQFEVWQRFGQLDKTLAQIRKDWGPMIRYGATTTWETFQVFPRSHAHAWSAAPAFVLGNQLLGVEKVDNGFTAIRLSPPETELDWAEGSIPTPYGRIDASWSREGGKRTMRVRIPAQIKATIDEAKSDNWEIDIVMIGQSHQ
ncbi:hypothetical protein EBB07_18140 [Paenibacillaceae bacterium]|nr:hypothetical protein EBB07_18140 [Paenibacillaceae bacterium]